MYRLIFFVLLLSACSNNNLSDQNTEKTDAAEKTETRELRKPDSMNQAAEIVIANISNAVTLTPEQKAQINSLVAEYDLASFNTDRGIRAKIRQRVMDEVLTPDQVSTWKAFMQKNRSSVTIE